MTVQITIVGLGQIGCSVGLALAEHTELVYRIGHDRDMSVARHAEKQGALDKVLFNLPGAVREADIVLLSLPMDQIEETLNLIAEYLKDGAVVMDTGPVKEVVADWAQKALPEGRYYLGLTPVLNPAYLHELESGVVAAHPDLFKGGMLAIVSPPGTPSEAIKLGADLTRLLGADPFFVDPLEMDGLMATSHVLPQIMAAALLNATVDQPGWREGRKVAGRAYAEATSPIVHPTAPESLSASAMLNGENVVRAIDGVIASLQALRSDIAEERVEELSARLARARRGRESWWSQRQTANWEGEEVQPEDLPKVGEWLGRMMGFRGRPDEEE